MRFVRSIFLAAVAFCALVPLVAHAQSSPNSLLLGTITADGQPAPSLRTVITVTASGVECGNTIPQGGTFSMVLSCPTGVAYVNVNGVPVAAIDVVPLGTVVVRLSIPAQGAPTPIATGVVPVFPTAPPGSGPSAPRPPATGNTPVPGHPRSMPPIAVGGFAVAAALAVMAKVGGRRVS